MDYDSRMEIAKALDRLTRVLFYEKMHNGNSRELKRLDTICGKLDELYKLSEKGA